MNKERVKETLTTFIFMLLIVITCIFTGISPDGTAIIGIMYLLHISTIDFIKKRVDSNNKK